MSPIKNSVLGSDRLAVGCLLLIGLFTVASDPAFPQESSRAESIDATARGTETQMGKEFTMTLTIYEHSFQRDIQILTEPFQNGGATRAAHGTPGMTESGFQRWGRILFSARPSRNIRFRA
jgi:hypothetical protein